MRRALTIQRKIVPQTDRAKYLARVRTRRDYYERVGCRFWICEEAELPGAFIEFTEADDRKVLSAAHENAPEPLLDARRVYQEVEF